MVRTAFFLLVLANLLFFVWTQGYLGVPANGREPLRLSNQLAPEKLRVIGSGATPVQSQHNCRLVTGVALSELQRLQLQAREKFPDLRLTVKLNDAPKNIYWVLIPPLGNRLASDKKTVELKKLAIPAFSQILDEGPDQFAILLGVFNSELAAGDYLRELEKRGVRSAKLQARENPLDKAQLEARGSSEQLARQLAELLQGQATARSGDCAPVP